LAWFWYKTYEGAVGATFGDSRGHCLATNPAKSLSPILVGRKSFATPFPLLTISKTSNKQSPQSKANQTKVPNFINMLTKLSNFLLLALCGSMASAVNLRNGPKTVGADLSSFTGSTGGDAQANRRLAMKAHMMRELADFDWDVEAEPDFPTISFEGGATDSEIRFKYNYTGIVTDNKYLKYSIFQGDCVTEGSPGALEVLDEITIANDKEYQFDVNVLQATITETPEYTDIDVTSAVINFCVRVDYYYDENGKTTPGGEDSINFHETNVTISIDLTANFTLTAVNVQRIDADAVDEDVQLDCEVQAYFCDESSNPVSPEPTYQQGALMTVCVQIAESDKDLYHLNDVLEMSIEQEKTLSAINDVSQVVANQLATGLSDKKCKNGICNIRHQLASKFFNEQSPNALDISGVGICAFGPLSLYTRRVDRAYESGLHGRCHRYREYSRGKFR
jgi:hypothetical protein